MPECGIPFPCSSTVSSFETALEIVNTERGGVIRAIQDNPLPGEALYGESRAGIGVKGVCRSSGTGVEGAAESGVNADSPSSGNGVCGRAEFGIGVLGTSIGSAGVRGEGGRFGVLGCGGKSAIAGFFEINKKENNKTALHAQTRGGGSAVEAVINAETENDRPALFASTNADGEAVAAETTGSGSAGVFSVRNRDNSHSALSASTNGNGVAVFGLSANGIGIVGGGRVLAGLFLGDVDVTGNIAASSKTFVIDHPLDPANKYLIHSSVESSEMVNVYSGNAVLDENGEAWIQLEAWFEAVNCDFRYQLTCIRSFAPIYIAEEVQNNRFKIAGGSHQMKVSWQVTAVRKDLWAQRHSFFVEKEKPADEKGYYRHPELYGQPPENSVHRPSNLRK